MQKDAQHQTLKEQGFYHTPAWRKVRQAVLLRDHYLCQLRLSKNCTRKATVVHHIKELEDYPELALDVNNLVSVCWFCHEETKQHKEVTGLAQALANHVRVIRVTGKTNE